MLTIDHLREIRAYNPNEDTDYIRFDVRIGKEHLYVTYDASKDLPPGRCRADALDKLGQAIADKGLDLKDWVKLNQPTL